jgi:hypothetical protein
LPSARIAASTAQMHQQLEQAIATAPPEQRAQLEAMLRQMEGGNGGSFSNRFCVSPAMANRNAIVVDPQRHCPAATVTRSGNHGTYAFSCTTNGVRTVGRGEATYEGNRTLTRTDVTRTEANGTRHVMHTESEITYLGADCGEVKPADAM